MSLGLEDGRIPDGAMSASSVYNSKRAAKHGRLNLAGAWGVNSNYPPQWLQIDLGRGTTVTKVATQGRQDADQWVTSYSISYSPARTHWVYVITHGKKTVYSRHIYACIAVSYALAHSQKLALLPDHSHN